MRPRLCSLPERWKNGSGVRCCRGQSADGVADHGPIVCACFGVGLKLIRNAIATGEATDVAGIGKVLRAGTQLRLLPA